jgi:regulatory protein
MLRALFFCPPFVQQESFHHRGHRVSQGETLWGDLRYRYGMAFSRPKRRQYSEDEMYEYAVGALARRMRTVAELKRLMRARVEEPESEYAETLVELVIRRLKDQGYLNDAKYAAYYSSMRRDNQKFGRRRVETELKTRGVHGTVIEKAIESAYDGVSEEKQAREYLRKKRMQKPKDQKQTARIFRQMMRAGFGMKTIFSILKKWDVDDETLSVLESETSEG